MDEVGTEATFPCSVSNCKAEFTSIARYEAHYESTHRHRCATCGWVFCTERLLDLHLSEMHDSYFACLAERKPMYQCLVEGCGKVYRDSNGRRQHMIKQHLYPRAFDFHLPPGVRRKAPSHKINDKTSKGKDISVPKKRQCHFYATQKGCAKGKNCPFLHDKPRLEDETDAAAAVAVAVADGVMNNDMEVDETSDLARRLESLSIPQEISFGRRGKKIR
ncbi:unnamed protein product [Chrysoparadoxa australica]